MQAKKNVFLAFVCQRIREAAERRGISKIDLASRADISCGTVYSIFNGTAHLRPKIIRKIAKALDVAPEDLTGTQYGYENKEPQVLRECSEPYGKTSEPNGPPTKMSQAIRLIADQLEIPPEEIFALLCEFIKKRKTEKTTVTSRVG